MIAAATSLGGKTESGKAVCFEISPAEECSKVPGVEPESVDLLTAAMAAHWFDMDAFWSEAAQVLKPGGTIALWTCASCYCHPSTTNAAEVQRILFRLERESLAPYELPPNRISRDLYDNLLLPWNAKPPNINFPPSLFVRREWDRDGILSNGEDFFGGSDGTSLQGLEKEFSTASMVTRWRAANPELLNSDKDCVRKALSDIKEALQGQQTIVIGHGTALLLFKKSVPFQQISN
ncbi:MAG: hypothetical protein M1827_002833 [Pycnora praestabilis]|nr:MAG: hypothetical protein M1827_002833 [Pycnora praestabilis]